MKKILLQHTKKFGSFTNQQARFNIKNVISARQPFNFFKQTKKQALILSGILLSQSIFSYYKNKIRCEDNQKQDAVSRQQKIEALKQLQKFEILSSHELKEGQMIEITLPASENFPNEYKILVTRQNGKIYVLGAYCLFEQDGKIPLSNGKIFGNKLVCPMHGCAYSIDSGNVEIGPALDNLPRFFAEEVNGKIVVYMPKYPPKKVRNPITPRDYNDLRKVVIVGNGIAAQTCAETLRTFGYTGELTIISSETKLPYYKDQLRRDIKNLKDYESLQIRPDDWYEQNNIIYMLGRTLTFVDNTHGQPYIQLEDGLNIEYDALVLCTGVSEEHRQYKGLNKKSNNLMYLRDIEDHKKLRSNLEKAKKLIVLGYNLKSLETVSTIRQQYPKLDILVVDENDENFIEFKYGKELSDLLLNLHLDHSIKFLFQNKIEQFETDKDQNIKQIDFIDGQKFQTDAVLCFPNNVRGNLDYLDNAQNLEELQYDYTGRLKVDYNLRSDHKRVFAAGDVCSVDYFLFQGEKMQCDNWNQAHNTGIFSAYNVLGLNIPYHVIPFKYTIQYDKVIQFAGYTPMFNKVHIQGDLKNFDFTIYYSFNDDVVQVAGTPNFRASMLILTEAFRLQMMPKLSKIMERGFNTEMIYRDLRQSRRSGCFRDIIFDFRYDPRAKDILWIRRDRSNEFYNFWKQGLEPIAKQDVKEAQKAYYQE